MAYPIAPTQFDANPYQPEWLARDFFHSPDGVKEFPDHHCKQTFVRSEPFIRSPVRNAIDVGCRDGEYARYLQARFKHTYCFDPRRRKFFPFNVELARVSHFTCALGDVAGDIHMYGGAHNPRDTKDYVVPCYTLDSFELPDIDYIKIDVEGYELRVLKGASRLVERDRPIIVIEQNDVRLPDEPPYAARDWLIARGYRVAATCPRGWDHVMVPG